MKPMLIGILLLMNIIAVGFSPFIGAAAMMFLIIGLILIDNKNARNILFVIWFFLMLLAVF
jgi:hypothetical protein